MPLCKTVQSTLPVWGATRVYNAVIGKHGVFQSTLPVWGATRSTFPLCIAVSHFNPRSPCGERHNGKHYVSKIAGFQSTLPVWGATLITAFRNRLILFQSTLPVWGATCDESVELFKGEHFNPRSPCGERRHRRSSQRHRLDFNPRSPCGERQKVGQERRF